MNPDNPPSSNGKSWWDRLKTALSSTPQDLPALVEVLRDSESRNILHPEALKMLEGALRVAELQVRDIMVPQVQMVCVPHDADLESIVKTAVKSGHSRFPVVGDDKNEVLGILLAKDLLPFFVNGAGESFDLKKLMRDPAFAPETKRLNVLLREFRNNRNHIAIVVDEYGVVGLVTIEDVIEEIVGEIEDEHDHDDEEAFIAGCGKDGYKVNALTSIDDFNKHFGTRLNHDDYDTIGGLIIDRFGRLPKAGETTDLAGYGVTVLRADKRKIELLRFEKSGG